MTTPYETSRKERFPANSPWKMTLEELVAGVEGRVLSQFERSFGGVGTDTRADLSGKIFIALKGETFDAHDFLPQAIAAGAAALVVHRIPDAAREALSKATVVQVQDTLAGLQLLGNFWRHKMRARILGVTGTNGKTTTKEFAAAILGSKLKVQFSKGSFNNHWGVPLSLLAIDSSHEAAVIEMGMNHPGELARLSEIAEPDVVMCTMVGRGHLEGVGSIEGVAKAKSEIYEHAPTNAIRVFNLENEHTRGMYATFGRSLPPEKVITFAGLGVGTPSSSRRLDGFVEGPVDDLVGLANGLVDVAFEAVAAGADSLHIRGRIRGLNGEAVVPVFGRHNVTNLMASACLALACGLTPDEIWKALPHCRTTWGRNQWVDLESGARVLFDAYNANPESMRAAIENFAALVVPGATSGAVSGGGHKFVVLGEMREMGDAASAVHRELGEIVARAGFDGVCFLGPSHQHFEAGLRGAGFSKKSYISDAYEQKLAGRMLPVLDRNDRVLIKGSRGMQLEKVLMDLKPVDFRVKS